MLKSINKIINLIIKSMFILHIVILTSNIFILLLININVYGEWDYSIQKI